MGGCAGVTQPSTTSSVQVSTIHLNTAMSRNLHLSQVFDLKGKVAFVSGKDLGNPDSSAEELMIR